jgi:amidase
MSARRARTAFVPHDLTAPLVGALEGPLAGLTAAVKDMYDIAGHRTGGGSPEWLNAHPPAASTAAAVRRILDAGATVIGKTVCDEFFYSVTGANAHYGIPINPRAPGRLPGGSSSGSASATAAGACDFALGSDTGGSVRVPAAFCGLYGIRPTHGRIDLTGAMPMAPSFDVAGWFAAGPGLFRHVGDVLLDDARISASLRDLIILDDAFAEADAGVAALLQAALNDISDELPKQRRGCAAPGVLIHGARAFGLSRPARFGPITASSSNAIGRGSDRASVKGWNSQRKSRIGTSSRRARNKHAPANASALWRSLAPS